MLLQRLNNINHTIAKTKFETLATNQKNLFFYKDREEIKFFGLYREYLSWTETMITHNLDNSVRLVDNFVFGSKNIRPKYNQSYDQIQNRHYELNNIYNKIKNEIPPEIEIANMQVNFLQDDIQKWLDNFYKYKIACAWPGCLRTKHFSKDLGNPNSYEGSKIIYGSEGEEHKKLNYAFYLCTNCRDEPIEGLVDNGNPINKIDMLKYLINLRLEQGYNVYMAECAKIRKTCGVRCFPCFP